jgi:hypothetical protein
MRQANRKCKSEFIEHDRKYPGRSIMITIRDDAGREFICLGFRNGKVVERDKMGKPTIKMILSKRAFRRMLKGEYNENDLFYGDLADFVGKDLLKHKVILSHLCQSFRDKGLVKEG